MKTAKAENRPPSQGGTGNYIKRKSVIPGVTITQFVEELPDGCSAPDFERRPIPLTIQEGKTATFKAVVKGSPMPEVRWARAKGELGDADKYKMTYDRGINEHTLQVIKADPDDADSYRCFATNEYGEAMCAAVLIIIEVGFKKKAKKPTMEQDVGKSDPQDFRKMLKKRAPPPVQKQEKAVDEKVWELLMNADKKDYEKICLDHGITDFRWMLKKLQEMKKEQQDQQQQYVKEVIKLRHVEVNPEEGASFEVEMDLKNPNSKIYIYKDGELIQYSFDSGRKHYLRQLGKKYSFHVNDLEDSDAGIYKMTVEDVTIFTTELELMMIPVNFSSKLKELYCKEWDNAVFECTLTQPFPKVMWLFKGQPLTDSNKYEMSVSPDGLTHRLVVKEVRPVDKGGYTILAGIRSSSAWLNVEIEGDGDLSLRKRRKLGEEAGEENKGLQSGQVDYTDKENLRNLQKESSGADQDGLRAGEGDDLYGRGKGGKGGSGDLLGRGKGGKGGSGDLDGKGMGGIGGQDGPSGSNKDGRKGLQDSPLSGLRGSGKDDGSQWGASAGDGKDSLAGLHGAGKGEQSGLQDGLDGSGKDASRGLHGSLGGSGANQGGLNDREGLSGKDGSGASGQGKGSRDTNLKSRLGSGSGINEADGGDKYGKGELGVKGGLFAGDSDGLQDKSAALGVSNLSDGSDALAGGEGKMLGDRSGDRMTAGHGKGSSYGGQASGQDGLAGAGLQDGTDFGDAGLGGKGSSQRGQRGEKLDLEGSGDLADQNLKNKDRRAGANLQRDKPKEPACRVSSGLADVQAGKGQAAEFCCMLTDDKEEGTWFKNGAKISSQEGLTIRKEGSVHKLVIDCVQDTDSGKYRFEVMGLKCEAELYVEDPPAVDQDLLKKLAKEPLVVKAGHTVAVKVPFEGRQPIRASWYKDGDELVEDSRIRLEKAGNYARLSISKCSRKDSGDLKLKLKNESGVIEANMKITVLDKPLPPQGPVEVLENSATQISIKWKPPRDDGGRPVQHYTVEKQQVGRNTWLKVGEVNKGITTFTTDKVEHGKKYIFKIQAVSSEGISEPLKSDEVMAGTKAFPGAPDPPRIADTSSKSISLTWVAPQNTGGSRLVGYLVEKRKKGSSMWMEVNKELIPERKFTVTDVMEGLQYEFRVTAVNTSGPGEPSSPSEAVFAREPMKPPGQVKGLKLSDSSYTSISLQWGKPDSEEGGEVEGYFVEVRSGKEINWRQCNISPIRATNYTINDLEAMELYFLRVIAINDGGLGKPRELGTYVLAMPPPVRPRFTLDSGWKRYMTVKAGSSIRVNIPFQASPTPEVFWLKDNISLSKRATITNSEGISQLLIPSSERIDSGMYTIVLKSYFGQESFSFEIRVTDIPRPPGPIRLDENVPKTVTVSWDASPDEKHDDRLHYLVMKRDTDNMSWHMVTDLIFNNKYTVANIIPGHKYYFRVMAKNDMGVSDASETQEPWIIFREKDKFTMREPHYRKVDQSQAPRILVGLKPHVVLSGCDCCMSCAVRGSPKPQVTWYHNNKDVTEDPAYWSSDISGVCSLVICCVTSKDSGEYKVIAQNPLGKAVSSSRLIVTERDIPLSAAL
nr:PREDICTED: immunoglobulin-like and fibronectin type III domain-containing protein 1 [Latimeria chalumnae]|eukprot:XP_014343590.1 PREDICTED: immunoglobulin-like and fibronectin type III domain-containing protein 1 [Latimeria chalumnae]